MRRVLAIGAAAVVALFFEVVFVPRLAPGLQLPDVFLVLAVHLALRDPTPRGALLAFTLGYLQDAAGAGFPGANAFGLSAAFLAVHLTSRRLWVENTLSQVVVVFGAWVVKTLAVLFILAVVLPHDVAWRTQAPAAVIQGGLAAFFAPAIFAGMARVERLPVRAGG